MTQISNELAEILGLLCAEGCHVLSYSSYWEKTRYRKNKKSERIEFYNKDMKLLLHYKKLLLKEFGYSANITKDNKINIGKRSIIQTITQHTPLGHLKWRVASSVRMANKSAKISFLRGYFDGDGTSSGRIRFFSSNKRGLLQVSCLLKKFELTHTFQGPILKPNRKPSYVLQVSEKQKENFLNIIRPISKKTGLCGGKH